jgi:membrane protein YqaA with SNARE-associated domain
VTDPASRPARPEVASGRLQRVYHWLHDFAERGWSATAVFAYGVLQSLIVPGLSDALFLPLSLAKPARAYRLAVAAGIGTLVGASLLYWAGGNALVWLTGSVGPYVGVTPDGLARAESLLTNYGWLLVVGSTFSPISTKLLSASAGAFGMPYPLFIAALGVSRFARVFLFAWAIRKFGAKAVREAFGLKDEDAEATPSAA